MRTAYRVETVRAAERALMARLPEGALMQRAAAGLAAVCAQRLGRVSGSRVALLVGPGDNGGDALYAGARLARRGAGVWAVPMDPERMHPGGLAALLRAGGRTADRVPERVDLVLDGLVGIGGRGGLRAAAAGLADGVPAGVPVVAVDLPSGVDADTGETAGRAVAAGLTVTFGAYKPGLLIEPGASLAGEVRLVDIGLELPGPPGEAAGEPAVEALEDADVRRLLPVPTAASDKYRRGVVGLIAGSAQYPGAAVLAVAGALRGGAGAVRYVGPAADAVLARYPEVLIGRGRVQAWVMGPGLGSEEVPLPAGDVPLLADADGLRGLTPEAVRARTAETLLTPHAGEAAALLGVSREEVERGRLAAVRELADRFGAVVLLKGAATLVCEPGGRAPVRVNPTGSHWLATAGSGDVLSGLAGSLLAAGLRARDAGAVAAYLHGRAAELASGAARDPARASGAPITAHEVALALPAAWRSLT
ncbi:NAD(P)H-hydrate dehydratase [Streptomyces venezuelae]|uniref:Bifunctional NAD(P)H-hydrate repair enzyme n=1 Tax=Streptomyces venezuelae TaxID=54571 RepID=A0A5P2D563_STRVZ|nr:NAD(P)H-hydrate dehydratase [Streptomyces venezuelae]QES49690.1 NAD(P)H-hydrate dehydratase [Streptomyces venezuelae]